MKHDLLTEVCAGRLNIWSILETEKSAMKIQNQNVCRKDQKER